MGLLSSNGFQITPHLDKYPNAELLWCQVNFFSTAHPLGCNNTDSRRSRSTMEHGLMLALAFSPLLTRHNTIGENIPTTRDVVRLAQLRRVARYEMSLLLYTYSQTFPEDPAQEGDRRVPCIGIC